MKLNRIILKDFLSFDDFEYEFEDKPLLVQGLNLTEVDQKSNGAGKSAMQTAIEMCIAATNSRGVKDAELVTYGQSESNIQLYASCDVRKQNIHIHWKIKVSGSNVLKVRTQNNNQLDWEEASFSNVNDGKKFVLGWFDISKDDLFNYYLINNERFKSFFKSSQKEKVDLINRFSDASIIDGLDNIDNTEQQAEYDETENSITSLSGKIEYINNNIQKENLRDYASEMEEEKESLEDDTQILYEKIDDIEALIINNDEAILGCDDEHSGCLKDIEEINEDKTSCDTEISEVLKHITEIGEFLEAAQTNVQEYNTTDWDSEREDYEADIKSDKKTILDLRTKDIDLSTKETKILTFLQDINVKLEGQITCPSCEHKFVLHSELSIEDLQSKNKLGKNLLEQVKVSKTSNEAAKKIIEDGIDSLEELISGVNKKEQAENSQKQLLIDTANTISTKLNDRKTQLLELETEKSDLEKDITEIRNKIDGLSNKKERLSDDSKNKRGEIKTFNENIKIINKQIKSLQKGNSDEAIKVLEKDKKSVEKEIVSLEVIKQKQGDVIYMRNQWKNNFKQFRMHLANQSLEVIGYHCNRYLKGMNTEMRVEFEGYRLLASGAIKDEITATIIRDVERSFSSFSGGEKGRLLFASILANRHMINSTHKYGGLDFLSVDEIFEGVDSLGLRNLIKSAKSLEIACMIITHVSDEDTSGDVLTIVKENGVSTIKK